MRSTKFSLMFGLLFSAFVYGQNPAPPTSTFLPVAVSKPAAE